MRRSAKLNNFSKCRKLAVREWRHFNFPNVNFVRLTPIRIRGERLLTMIANLRAPSLAGIKIHESNRDHALEGYRLILSVRLPRSSWRTQQISSSLGSMFDDPDRGSTVPVESQHNHA